MSVLTELMRSPRSKIQRANRHIDELRKRSDPLDRELYRISNSLEYASVIHLQPTVYKLSYRPEQDIPDVFATIIGDVLGNIRSALDHIAVGIVKKWGAPPAGPLYFPITKRKDLIAHSGLTAIEQALPGSKEAFLKEVRPESGRDEHLWDFYTLNKDDKHNFLIPTIVGVRVCNINAKVGGSTFVDCTIGFDATRPATLIQSSSPITIDNNFKTVVDVKFSQGTPFENDPVVPTLLQISQLVSETLNWFERFIRTTKNVD